MIKRVLVCLFLMGSGVALQETVRADTIDGSCLEAWELMNFQPQSPTFNQRVKSSQYQSRATVVMLLASW